MRLRDVVIFFAGVFIGALIQLFRDKPPAVWKRLNPIGKFYRRPGYRGLAFLGWHGEKDTYPKAKREYPPLQPGGPHTETIDNEIFSLMQEQNLKPEQAWQECIRRYPEILINPDTEEAFPDEMIPMLKESFKERMRNRKRKQGW